jgi:hypothetical protein
MSAGNRRRPVGANDNHPAATAEDCREDQDPMTDVGTLGFAAQFLVWALRSWVGAFKSNQDFALVTEDAFQRFGLAGAATSIDAAMMIVAASASRSIDIRCIKCRFLSPDEAIVIDAIAAIQADTHFSAYAGLNKLMPMAAVRSAFPHLVNLAGALAEARLRPQPISRPLGAIKSHDDAWQDTASHAPGHRYLH